MEVIGTAEAAKILKLTDRQIRYLAAKEKLPGNKTGRDWLFDRRAIEQEAERRGKNGQG